MARKAIIRLGPNLAAIGNLGKFELESRVVLPCGVSETPYIHFKTYGIVEGTLASILGGENAREIAEERAIQLSGDEIRERGDYYGGEKKYIPKSNIEERRKAIAKEDYKRLISQVKTFRETMRNSSIELANTFGRSDSEYGAGFGFGLIASKELIKGGIMRENGKIKLFSLIEGNRKTKIENIWEVDSCGGLVIGHEAQVWHEYLQSPRKTPDKKRFLENFYFPN